MMRVSALRNNGAFNEAMIAGEEAELCVRLRNAGWKIHRIDVPMTLHDAAIISFQQWWRRSRRSGHAFAEGAWLHGFTKERHNVKSVLSIILWGLALPSSAALSFTLVPSLSVAIMLAYGILWWRIMRDQVRKDRSHDDARLYATFIVLGKMPQALGVLQFIWTRLVLRQTQSQLIEYKSPARKDN
jgi:cellulose synthase/poly-beta-1,6-N-acetylglucosamine synthase-like glycosyltransferase